MLSSLITSLAHQKEPLKSNIPVSFPNLSTPSHLFSFFLLLKSSPHPSPALFSSGLLDLFLLILKKRPEVAFLDPDLAVHLGWERALRSAPGIPVSSCARLTLKLLFNPSCTAGVHTFLLVRITWNLFPVPVPWPRLGLVKSQQDFLKLSG